MTKHEAPITVGEPPSTQLTSGWWADEYGIVGPFKPGHGPRSDPRAAFSTGPDQGERFPSIVARDQFGSTVDIHEARGGGPAVVVFSRATVW